MSNIKSTKTTKTTTTSDDYALNWATIYTKPDVDGVITRKSNSPIDHDIPRDDCVFFYEKCGFKGKRLEACDSNNGIKEMTEDNFNDRIKSIKLGKNAESMMYKKPNFKGTRYWNPRDLNCDKPKGRSLTVLDSTKPKDGCIFVYVGCHHGSKMEICASDEIYNPGVLEKDFDKKITSVRAGKHAKAIIYTDQHFRGNSKTITSSNGDICFTFNSYFKNLHQNVRSIHVQDFNPVGDNCIFVYSECDYKGRKMRICSTESQKKLLGFERKIASIKFGKNAHAVVYDRIDFKGNKKKLNRDTRCLDKNFNKKIKSILVLETLKDECIFLYDHCNYGGDKIQVCNDDNLTMLGDLGNFNDKISSIRVGKFSQAVVYQDNQFRGSHLDIKEDIACLKSQGFSNNISSVKINEKPLADDCILIFEDSNYGGRKETFCSNKGKADFKDFKISSIILGKYAEALVHKEPNFQGEEFKIAKDNRDLISIGLNNMITSIHVRDTRPIEDECIFVYSKCDYKGKKLIFCGKEEQQELKHFDKKISSIRVGKYARALVYLQKSFGGNVENVSKDVKCLNSGLNNKIRSVKVAEKKLAHNCIFIYSECRYKGLKKEVCSKYHLGWLGNDFNNKQVASIKLGNTSKVSVYDRDHLQGKETKITKSIECLDNSTNIRSVKVIERTKPHDNCIFAYDQCNYKGNRLEICSNEPKNDLGDLNNKVYSFKLGKNAHAQVYAGKGYTGQNISFVSDRKCLSTNSFALKNKIQSINVKERKKQKLGDYCIELYLNCSDNSAKKRICRDEPQADLGFFNNKKIGIKFGFNAEALLYKEYDFKGEPTKSKRNSKKNINDILCLNTHAQSLKVIDIEDVKNDCIYLYTECNYSGRKKKLCGRSNSIEDLGDFQKQISSIKVGKYARSYVYKEKKFEGTAALVDSDVECLSNNEFDNSIKSIKIEELPLPDHCIYLFDQCNYQGNKLRVCRDKNKNTIIGIGLYNDFVRSIKVGKYAHPQLYKDYSFKGASKTYKDVKCFTGNDIHFAKSVKVLDLEIPPKNCIFFYTETNHTGKRLKMCAGEEKGKLGEFDLAIESIKIGQLAQAYLYKDENFGVEKGEKEQKGIKFHSGSYLKLRDDETRKFRSIKLGYKKEQVANYCIVVFSECNFKGKITKYCRDQKDLQNFDGKIKSIEFAEFAQVTLYKDKNFKGDLGTVTKNIKCLSETDLLKNKKATDTIRSIKFSEKPVGDNCVSFYNKCNYKSFQRQYCGSISELSLKNENYQSFRVGKHAELIAIWGKMSTVSMDNGTNMKNAFFNLFKSEAKKPKYFHILKTKTFKKGYPCLHNQKPNKISIKDTTPVKEGCILAYTGCKYTGEKKEICMPKKLEDIKADLGDDFDKKINSIRFGKNTEAIVYEQPSFRHSDYINDYHKNKEIFSKDISCLQDEYVKKKGKNTSYTWKDRIRSIYVQTKSGGPKTNCIQVIDDCMPKYWSKIARQRKIELCGTQSIKDLKSFRRRGIMIKYGKNTKGIAFAKTNFYGHEYEAKDSVCLYKMPPKSFKILEIVPDHCIWFYTKCEYKGEMKQYCFSKNSKGHGDLKDLDKKFSSIRVGKTVEALVYRHKNFKGKPIKFRNSECLANEDFENKIRSFKVSNRGPDDNCVFMYSKCNFEGKKTEICSNQGGQKTYYTTTKRVLVTPRCRQRCRYENRKTNHDSFKSIKVGKYATAHFKNNKSNTKDQKCLTDKQKKEWGTTISVTNSRPIEENCIFFYSKCNYQGKQLEVCGTKDEYQIPESFMSSISSIKIGKRTQVDVYTKRKLHGSHKKLTTSVECLDKAFQNKVQSAKITTASIDDNCVQVYENCKFEGRRRSFCGNQEISELGHFDKKITSIIVGKYAAIEVYTEQNFKGKPKSFDFNINCLNSAGYGRNIRSVKIKERISSDNCAQVYLEKEYKGRMMEICDGTKDLKGLIGFENKISSIKVGKYAEVGLHYSSIFYNYGTTKTFSRLAKSNADVLNNSVFKLKSIKVSEKVIDDNCVYAYEDCEYKGRMKKFCGNKEFKDIGDFTNIISSIKIGRYVQAIIYKNKNLTGFAARVTGNAKCLAYFNFENKISSLKVIEKPVGDLCMYAYSECNYRGRMTEICKHDNHGDLKDFDKNISSFKIGKFAEALVYTQRYFRGPQESFLHDASCLTGSHHNNEFRSIKIQDRKPYANCVFIFDKCNFKGKRMEFCGKKDFKELGGHKNKISFITGKRSRITLYQEQNFKGKSRKIYGDVSCIKPEQFSKEIKSMKVWSYDPFKGYNLTKEYYKKKLATNKLNRHLAHVAKIHKPKPGCIIVFSECNYKGKFDTFCLDKREENNDFTITLIWRKNSSIIVGDKTSFKYSSKPLSNIESIIGTPTWSKTELKNNSCINNVAEITINGKAETLRLLPPRFGYIGTGTVKNFASSFKAFKP